MSSVAYEITQLYNQVFGSKPHIVKGISPVGINGTPFYINKNAEGDKGDPTVPVITTPNNQYTGQVSVNGSSYQEEYLGVEIWLPTRLILGTTSWYLPYSTISVTGSNHWIETALAERKGTVKELFNVGDYKIALKGFFIDKANRLFPASDIQILKSFHESGQALGLENALSDIFLSVTDKVVINSFDMPPVTGGKKSMRPFAISLTSDSVFTLEVA